MTEEKLQKQVLVISCRYPPKKGIGPMGTSKLVKYLHEFGWKPIVVSAYGTFIGADDPNSSISDAEISKYTLTSNILRLFRNLSRASTIDASPELSAQPSIPGLLEPFVFLRKMSLANELFEPHGWAPIAEQQCAAVISSNPIDLIFSSHGPSVNHIVASKMHKRFNIPWVAEYRDPWSDNHDVLKIEPLHFAHRVFEKRVVSGSNRLTCVSERWAAQLSKLHQKHCEVIKNGFDPDDYRHPAALTKQFTITYTGTIYPGKQDPEPLFKAVNILISNSVIARKEVSIRFYGSDCRWLRVRIKNQGLSDVVTIFPPVPHEECCVRQMESTLLLVLGWNDKKESGVYPLKVFEYLGAGRPIISLSHGYECLTRLVEETGTGVATVEVDALVNVLTTWINEYRDSGEIISYFYPKRPVIDSYSRQVEAGQMAMLFDKTVSRATTT